MNRSLIVFASLAALLAACSEQKKETAPAAAEPEPMALGLKVSQFDGSNLLQTNGSDLGDVVRVDVNSEGKATGLIVAPTGPGQRWVRLPLAGLTTKVDGPYHDVVTTLTWEEVKALPAWVP
ncbi:MAG TPA: hypothetical protein VLZ73_02935 [Brevundimonas sp.]|nr:hypothetical protein [Brevundimonas sp.]